MKHPHPSPSASNWALNRRPNMSPMAWVWNRINNRPCDSPTPDYDQKTPGLGTYPEHLCQASYATVMYITRLLNHTAHCEESQRSTAVLDHLLENAAHFLVCGVRAVWSQTDQSTGRTSSQGRLLLNAPIFPFPLPPSGPFHVQPGLMTRVLCTL